MPGTMGGRQVQDAVPSIVPVSRDLTKGHDGHVKSSMAHERYASIISIHLFAVKIQKLELERILVASPAGRLAASEARATRLLEASISVAPAQ